MRGPLLLVLLLLPGAGCVSRETGGAVEARIGEPFRLHEGAAIAVPSERATLRFVAKTADSRCPDGTSCVTEGEATVRLEWTGEAGTPATFSLTGHLGKEGEAPVRLDTLGYRFILEKLTPYPQEAAVPRAPTVATLRVERL